MPKPRPCRPIRTFAAAAFAAAFALAASAAEAQQAQQAAPQTPRAGGALPRLNSLSSLLRKPKTPPIYVTTPRFREELRAIVDGLAQYAESRDPHFILIGRMPQGLMATSEWEKQRESLINPKSLDEAPIPDDAPGGPFRRIARDFAAIGLDDANCAAPPKPAAPSVPPTPEQVKAEIDAAFVTQAKGIGAKLVGLDACDGKSTSDILRRGAQRHIRSIEVIGAPDAPKIIPHARPPFENPDHVKDLGDVQNGIWLRNPAAYASKADWVEILRKRNDDLLIVDAFYKADQPLTRDEVLSLKFKYMGARRLLLASMDLSQARDDRYYWKREWRVGDPEFLREPMPGTRSGILVNYWTPEWKEILGAYFKGLMDLGFDGVLLEGLGAPDVLEKEVLLE